MSGDLAIRAEGLGKCYSIGATRPRLTSLREVMADTVRRIGSLAVQRPAAEEFWALKDFTADIKRGENIGLIGLNGAGKSTLLKILSRITEPSVGRAQITGRVGALLEVGTGFHLELSGRENVFLYGSILGMTRAEVVRKFDAIIEFSGVEQHLDVPLKRFSSGMKVRLAFAVAAHLDPDILFLDEVLAVGDLAFQRKCVEFARSLQRRDATILFVSHNMFSIKTMCQRVIYLRGGQVRFDGGVDEGIALYEDECGLSSLSWNDAPKQEAWPIVLRQCEMIGGRGDAGRVFDFAEPVTIRLGYEVRRPLIDPVFLVSFVRSDGVTACTFSTELDCVKTGLIGSDGVIELEVPPLKLVAESYAVHIVIREKGFQKIVCAQIGTTFHVRDPMLDTHFGVFHERAKWRLLTSTSRTNIHRMGIDQRAAT